VSLDIVHILAVDNSVGGMSMGGTWKRTEERQHGNKRMGGVGNRRSDFGAGRGGEIGRRV
jgi:hypothetical protein